MLVPLLRDEQGKKRLPRWTESALLPVERPASLTFMTTAPITEIAFTPNWIWGYKWNPKGTVFNKAWDKWPPCPPCMPPPPHHPSHQGPQCCGETQKPKLTPQPSQLRKLVSRRKSSCAARRVWRGVGVNSPGPAPLPQCSSRFFKLIKVAA